MRKTVSRFAAGVIAALMAATAIPSAADGGMNTERAMAGMSVALNNYYASSITAEGIGDILNDIALQRELEAQTETEETETETEPETEPEETQAPQPPSPYSNVAIAQVANEDGYVNVRTQPSTEGEIVGKIYNNCAATILETVAGENGDWYRIKSGSVEGYIKAEFFITGADAEQIAKQVGTVYATVTSPTLKVRAEMDLSENVKILTLLPLESRYIVTEEFDQWVYIVVDADTSGYVFKDCVSIDVEFKQAISIEEEQARIAEEQRRQREYELAQQALLAAQQEALRQQQQQQQQQQQSQTQPSQPQQPQNPETQPPETQAPETPYVPSAEVSTELRNAVCAYALQFVGNPYVWGGTSLTNGADCSGFVLSVMAQFGYSLPRTSASQAGYGTRIGLDQVQPGDLVFYSNNGSSIGHVGIYIGNGQIVHAASEQYGICVWNMYYKTPCAATRILP